MEKMEDREMERVEEKNLDRESKADVDDQLDPLLEDTEIVLPDLLGNYSEQTGAVFG